MIIDTGPLQVVDGLMKQVVQTLANHARVKKSLQSVLQSSDESAEAASVSIADLAAAIDDRMPCEIAKHGKIECDKIVQQFSAGSAGLQIDTSLTCRRAMPLVLKEPADVYLAAFEEYICAELLELAGNAQRKRLRQHSASASSSSDDVISAPDILSAVVGDEDLAKIFGMTKAGAKEEGDKKAGKKEATKKDEKGTTKNTAKKDSEAKTPGDHDPVLGSRVLCLSGIPDAQAFRAGMYTKQAGSLPFVARSSGDGKEAKEGKEASESNERSVARPWYMQRDGSQSLYYSSSAKAWCLSSQAGGGTVGLYSPDEAMSPDKIISPWMCVPQPALELSVVGCEDSNESDVALHGVKFKYTPPVRAEGSTSAPKIDKDGLFYHIGTRMGATDYSNPGKSNFGKGDGVAGVKVTCNSFSSGRAEHLTQNSDPSTSVYTGDKERAWMTFDIGDNRLFHVTDYCFRTDTNALMINWELQGAIEGAKAGGDDGWAVLKRHEKEPSESFLGSSKPKLAHFVVNAPGFYRYFRIRTFKKLSDGTTTNKANTNGCQRVFCGGIELYGTLSTKFITAADMRVEPLSVGAISVVMPNGTTIEIDSPGVTNVGSLKRALSRKLVCKAVSATSKTASGGDVDSSACKGAKVGAEKGGDAGDQAGATTAMEAAEEAYGAGPGGWLQPEKQKIFFHEKHSLISEMISEMPDDRSIFDCISKVKRVKHPPVIRRTERKVYESMHDYESNTDELIHVHVPGVESMTITFDDECRTENGHDFVQFFRDQAMHNDLTEKISGKNQWPGASSGTEDAIVVKGDSCWMKWETDGSSEYWGWKFAAVGTVVIGKATAPTAGPFVLRIIATDKELAAARVLQAATKGAEWAAKRVVRATAALRIQYAARKAISLRLRLWGRPAMCIQSRWRGSRQRGSMLISADGLAWHGIRRASVQQLQRLARTYLTKRSTAACVLQRGAMQKKRTIERKEMLKYLSKVETLFAQGSVSEEERQRLWAPVMNPSAVAKKLVVKVQPEEIKVGSKVRVKESIKKPSNGWGSVNHGSVGTMRSISGTSDSSSVTIDFPSQSCWSGKFGEIEQADTPQASPAQLLATGKAVSTAKSLETELLAHSRQSAAEKRLQVRVVAKTERRARVLACLRRPEVQSLRMQLEWADLRVNAYATLLARLEATVGLDNVKRFIRRTISDAVGRYALHEPLQVRHFLLQGGFGVGKKTAGELISLTLKVLGLVKEDCGPAEAKKKYEKKKKAKKEKDSKNGTNDEAASTSADTVAKLETDIIMTDSDDDDDDSCGSSIGHMIEVGSLSDAQEDGIKSRSIYYVRLGVGSVKPSDRKEGEILRELEEKQSCAIFAGSNQYTAAYSGLAVMRRRVPYCVTLPTLGAAELAAITATLAHQRGYVLRKQERQAMTAGMPVTPSRSGKSSSESKGKRNGPNVSVMRFIVAQRFSRETIEERNGHLARDMLELAVMRKNERLLGSMLEQNGKRGVDAGSADGAGAGNVESMSRLEQKMAQTVLTAADFDVKLPDVAERDARRRAVDAEVQAMVGWGKEGIKGGSEGGGSMSYSPKAFFEMARRTLLRQEKEREQEEIASDDADMDEDCAESATAAGTTATVAAPSAGTAVGPGGTSAESEQQRTSINWNVILIGGSGSGKSTFGKVLQRFLHAYGALDGAKDLFLERSGQELKGGMSEAIGEGGAKMQSALEEVKGGGLLIDDAHILGGDGEGHSSLSRNALHGGSGNPEVARALLKGLEDQQQKGCATVVILASGSKEGMGRLLRSDPKLPSRFPFRVHINDYTSEEVATIALRYARQQGYMLGVVRAKDIALPAGAVPSSALVVKPPSQDNHKGPEGGAVAKLAAHIEHVYMQSGASSGRPTSSSTVGGAGADGNGRLAVNLVEGAIQYRALRLDNAEAEAEQVGTAAVEGTPGALSSTAQEVEVVYELEEGRVKLLLPIDFGIGKKLGDELLKDQIDQELEQLVGMSEAKQWFQTLKNKVKLVDKTGDRTSLRTCLNMVITGNPGTGKTTFTRVLVRFLHAYGILPKDTFVEKNGTILIHYTLCSYTIHHTLCSYTIHYAHTLYTMLIHYTLYTHHRP
jgi:tRNA A37 threonylcarbamoyladenosine biosynthesis protein TsaE